jgi:hypothetical protein
MNKLVSAEGMEDEEVLSRNTFILKVIGIRSLNQGRKSLAHVSQGVHKGIYLGEVNDLSSSIDYSTVPLFNNH